MSQPVLPPPITSTLRPRSTAGSWYADACITWPRKVPSMTGGFGAQLCPLATTTAAYRWVRSTPPPVLRVVTSQRPSPTGTTETTSVPNQMCSPRPKCFAYRSR
jgi:hypothetical protein